MENDDAFNCYKKVLDIDPTNANAWYNKAEILLAKSNYSEAADSYKETLNLDPINIFALTQLHLIYSNYTYHYDKALSIAYQLLRKEANLERKAIVTEDLIKTGKYKDARGYALRALNDVVSPDTLYQALFRFLILSSYFLEGDSINGNRELVRFLDYYKGLSEDFRIEDKQWIFKGLNNQIETNDADPQIKSLLSNIISLLQGKTDRKRILHYRFR